MSGTSSLTAELYRIILRLWDFTREYNERGTSMPLPSYVYITFASPAVTYRIRKHTGLDVDLIGRCVEALIVNKLAGDINSRNIPVNVNELECLSVILCTKSDDVMLLLRYPGAIEFTNMVFLAWAIIGHSSSAGVPSDVLDVVQQTFGILSQAFPVELNARMRLDTLMNISNGQCELVL